MGRRIGRRYQVLKLIGTGGNGTVYEALDEQTRTRVALKVPKLKLRPASLERFYREGRAGEMMSHPNVCAMHGSTSLGDGTPLLVMEYLVGTTLDELLPNRLPLAFTLAVMSQVLAGLAEAHAKGIIHRDVKPANIQISGSPGQEIAKVLDFGSCIFARAGFEKEEETGLTSPGTLHGTVYYMAPEYIRGHDLDPRADVFACGVILYEATRGRRPFVGSSNVEVLREVLEAPITALRSIRPELPGELDAILARAMARDRELRYPDAAALRAAVEGLRAKVGEPDHGGVSVENRLKGLRSRFRQLAELHEQSRQEPAEPAASSVTVDIPIFVDYETATPSGFPSQ